MSINQETLASSREKDRHPKLPDQSGRILVFSRYFLKIPKYINRISKVIRKIKPIRQVNNFNTSIQIMFPKLERPLFILAIISILYEIRHDYLNKINENNKFKIYFLLDQLVWHTFGSFIIPSIFISNSIYLFVLCAGKLTTNSKIIKMSSITFSIFLITFSMNYLDNFTTYFMNRFYRKVIDYEKFSRESSEKFDSLIISKEDNVFST